jgi:dsDNA-binding SOS-regulon protein
MQNSAFSSHPSRWGNDKGIILEDWKRSMDTIQKVLDLIRNLSPVLSKGFEQIRLLRDNLKLQLAELRNEMCTLLRTKQALQQAELDMTASKVNTEQFKDFTLKTKTEKIVWEQTSTHNTLCQACNNLCHEDCGLAETFSVGHDTFKGCACMSDNSCSKCPGGCSYVTHFHARKKPKKIEEELSKILHDVKANYDAAVNAGQKANEDINTSKQCIHLLETTLENLKKDVRSTCIDITKMCKKFNLVRELELIADQYDMMKNTSQDYHEQQSLRELSQVISDLANQFSDQK